jgi:diaminopimelate epimerase
MNFAKYHALGNDYLVMEPAAIEGYLTAAVIRLICHPHYGVGGDGLLVGPLPSQTCDFRLRLFNPDGVEFEKSGNGLRIFARYLWDKGLVQNEPFTIETPGGAVQAQVWPGGRRVTMEMGQASFDSGRIPVTGPPREVLRETIMVDGQELLFCAVTMGNPHCVVLREGVSAEGVQRWGPLIEYDPRFPNRTNVQFMSVLDRRNIHIEIWERGVGYTLASGTSSCAAAAVAHRLGRCDNQITVHMPGGQIEITIGGDYAITMTGGVTKICDGKLAGEMMRET